MEQIQNTSQESFSCSSPKKTSFAADVLTLVSGTALAQVLSILAAPILSRLYGPEDFGLLGLFISITSIIGIIACLRYELTIMLPESEEEAANLLGLSLLMTFIISILTVPLIWFGKPFLLAILKTPQLNPYLWLVPPFVFVSGVFLALNYWNSRTKHYRRLSISRITSSVTTTGTQLGAGFLGYATGGALIGASFAGQLVSSLTLAGQIWKDDYHLLIISISRKKMLAGLKRYRDFPLISTWSGLLNTVSWQLPAFLLAAFFSPAVVGLYSMGFNLLQLPMNFIGSSIAQVFFQRAAEAKAKGTLSLLVEEIFRLLVRTGMFPILILAIAGRDVFSAIFGSRWAEAGVYVQILSAWAFIWFLSSPLSTLVDVLEKQQFELKANFFIFGTRFLSLLLGGVLGNARLALGFFSVSGIFAYGYFCFKLMLYSGVEPSYITKVLLSNFASFLPAGLILIVLKLAGVSSLFMVGVSVILGITYYLYLLGTDSQMQALRIR